MPTYQKGVDMTAPHSTHGVHDEDVILAAKPPSSDKQTSYSGNKKN